MKCYFLQEVSEDLLAMMTGMGIFLVRRNPYRVSTTVWDGKSRRTSSEEGGVAQGVDGHG